MNALTDFDVRTLGDALAVRAVNRAHGIKILRRFMDEAGELDVNALRLGKRVEEFLGSVALRQSKIVRRRQSADGTVKVLIEFARGGAVESVLMPAFRADRAAGCVSSQIGCAMG